MAGIGLLNFFFSALWIMSGGTLKKNVWRVQILLSSLKENSEPPY